MKLAYDVGGYNGDDTAHYLALGYRVICVEACPPLADEIKARFSREIAEGRCVVLNIGVGNAEGVLPFYLSRNPIWNSFDRSMAARAGEVREIPVQMRKLADVIDEYGSPEFVKMDVEGADYDCLLSIAESRHRPNYLSCEATGADGAEMIFLLNRMGFTKFNLMRQEDFTHVRIPEPGRLSNVKWSVRQLLRVELNRRPRLHRALVAGANALRSLKIRKPKHAVKTVATAYSAGPTPMEHAGEWHSPSQFVWAWQNMVYSGMVESSWWDIHAARDQCES